MGFDKQKANGKVLFNFLKRWQVVMEESCLIIYITLPRMHRVSVVIQTNTNAYQYEYEWNASPRTISFGLKLKAVIPRLSVAETA